LNRIELAEMLFHRIDEAVYVEHADWQRLANAVALPIAAHPAGNNPRAIRGVQKKFQPIALSGTLGVLEFNISENYLGPFQIQSSEHGI